MHKELPIQLQDLSISGGRVAGQMRTLARLARWVVGSGLLAVVGLDGVRHVVSTDALRPSNEVLGSYYQTLGGIYAVLLAFIVYAVWQQFNDARNQVEREASEVMELFRIAQALPEDTRRTLQRTLHAYCCGVLDREWPIMKSRNGQLESAELPRLLDEMWATLSSFASATESPTFVVGEATQCFNELCNARTARLSSSHVRLPTALRWLLYVGAGILVCSTWLFAVESFAMHAFIAGATAGSTAHVLYVIEDLDDCFSGDWQVPRAAFLRARTYMRERSSPEELLLYQAFASAVAGAKL